MILVSLGVMETEKLHKGPNEPSYVTPLFIFVCTLLQKKHQPVMNSLVSVTTEPRAPKSGLRAAQLSL